MNILVDKDLCMGCRICEIACSQKHFGVYNPLLARLRVPVSYPLPTPPRICLQCAKPRCAEACPTGALFRTERMVAFDKEKCLRCGRCVEACPFDRIWSAPSGQPLKCDLCGGEPECVALCGKHALKLAGEK